MKPWHEDDDFWKEMAPAIFGSRRWSDAPAEVERAISLLGLRPGMRVLDLGCGVGRNSLEFARRGLRVTGVDRTRAYLGEAAERARAAGLDVEWVQADMREFWRPGAFDAVASLYTSFGYFADPEEDRAVARNMSRSLRPGGCLLMDVLGKEVLARVFQERDWREEEGMLVLEERRLGPDWGSVESRWILVKESRRIERTFVLRLYSAVELRRLLRESGFEQVEAHGDLAGSPYDQTARRLVVVARKAAEGSGRE